MVRMELAIYFLHLCHPLINIKGVFMYIIDKKEVLILINLFYSNNNYSSNSKNKI